MSCGILPQKNNYHTTSQVLELGVVGDKEISVYKTDFETASIPVYTDFIKLSIEKKNFTRNIYKKYMMSVKEKNTPHKVNYIDSLEVKPVYLDFSINDKSLVIESLNKEENKAVLSYIKNVPQTKLITNIRVLLTKEIEKQIEEVDAFYIRTNQQKKQLIYLFKKEKPIGELDLSKTVIFGYKMSSFCWGFTEKKKIKLITLLSEGENCTSNTNRIPGKLEKEIEENQFKW